MCMTKLYGEKIKVNVVIHLYSDITSEGWSSKRLLLLNLYKHNDVVMALDFTFGLEDYTFKRRFIH